MNRRRFLNVIGGSALAAAATPRITFAQSPVASPAAMATPVGKVNADGYYPSGTPGVPDAYTKLPKPFRSFEGTPLKGSEVSALVMIYGAPPTPHDQNTYWKGLDERLGGSWKPTLAPNSSYGEKAAAIIASGDMPDLFYLNYNQTESPLAKFVQQGAFLDLTPYVTGDAVKEFSNLAKFPDFMWEATKLDGKIYGVPCPSGRSGQVPAFRKDWAQKFIGHTPANGEELYELFTQASKGDPDGNGKADTWGLARYETTWDMGILRPMHRVPNSWRVNDDGTFTKAEETEEFKACLAYQVRMFKDGLYHPDSAAMQFEQALQLFTSGRTLAHVDGGNIYGKGGFQDSIRQYQKDADLARLIPMGVEGGAGVTYSLPGIFGFTAIPATTTDDERIRELLRLFDWFSAPFGSEEWLFKNYGLEGTHFTYNANGFPQTTEVWDKENGGLTAYIGGTQLYHITPDQPEIAPLLTDEGNQVAKLGIENPASNLFSPSAVEKGTIASQVISDGIAEIITGRQPLDHLDAMLSTWRERGGDAIRKEFEEAHAKNKNE